MRRFTVGSALLLVTLFGGVLSGCGGGSHVVLPEGVLTVTGSIVAVPLSLERRGTHALIVEGEERYLLEGGSVDLHALEGKTVAVTGTVQQNIDPEAAPLFTVSSFAELHVEQEQAVTLSQLGMTLRVPASWGKSASGSTQLFVLADGSPALSVGREAALPSSADVPLLVGGKQAFRVVRGGAMTVLVPLGDGEAIAFRSLVAKPTPATDAVFIRLLTSVSFVGASSSSASPAVATGATLTIPCGGAAGLLCPPGSFCSITDRVNNIGTCQETKKKEGVR